MASAKSELLGKGFYGCVYCPPIPCPEGAKKTLSLSPSDLIGDATKVSKYGAWSDISRELFAYRQMNTLDPEFRWHLRVYGGCVIPEVEGTPSGAKEIYVAAFTDSPCEAEFLRYTSGPRGLLYMDRGSASLMEMLDGKAELPGNADLARSAENLVRGLMVMAESGIVYGDVGANNLVFGEDGLLRFIDFADVGFTNPDKAKLLTADDLESIQMIARCAMEAFPARERSHPEEFELLRAFVRARLWYAGKPLVTRDFSIARLPEDPHKRRSEGQTPGVIIDEALLDW